MAAIKEVFDDSQASGQPAGGYITPQNQPVSVSQTIVDKKHQSCEEDEVICLHHICLAFCCFLLLCYLPFGFLKNCYKVIIRIRKKTHDNWL